MNASSLEFFSSSEGVRINKVARFEIVFKSSNTLRRVPYAEVTSRKANRMDWMKRLSIGQKRKYNEGLITF